MACIINASTSAGLVQTADLSGVLQFQQNGVALPNGGVAPAFSATPSGTFTASNSTDTVIPANTVIFDTNSNYNNSTYRFTPTVAGYYQVSAGLSSTGTFTAFCALKLGKNGSVYEQIGYSTSTVNYLGAYGSGLVYLNGSTDYIQVYVNQNSGSTVTFNGGNGNTYFQACLVRGT
jgi:hypothetical protein